MMALEDISGMYHQNELYLCERYATTNIVLSEVVLTIEDLLRSPIDLLCGPHTFEDLDTIPLSSNLHGQDVSQGYCGFDVLFGRSWHHLFVLYRTSMSSSSRNLDDGTRHMFELTGNGIFWSRTEHLRGFLHYGATYLGTDEAESE